MRIVATFFFWVITLATVLVITVGVTGGIMYLNEKLNQFGTVLVGC